MPSFLKLNRSHSAGAAVVLVLLVVTSRLPAAGGTMVIARAGQPTFVHPGWPIGVDEIVNDPNRTSGWNSWFTEWPNDVNQYAFRITSADDLNRLIQKLAAVDAELKQIRLTYLKEPRGLGWVTQLDEGNGIPVIFSIGDQSAVDQWYAHVRNPFGVIEFTDTPVAVPPTLTIFVQNEAVNLLDLKVPDSIEVLAGYVPTVFHRSNTVQEQEAEKSRQAAEKENVPPPLPNLPPGDQAAIDKIRLFLKSREPTDEAPPT
ncbi:MAG: hypothetical protein KDA75_07255 [Planctomycetaceae bacterium]|nr:hypothetical protein [Planctomycetaceae bacterium]